MVAAYVLILSFEKMKMTFENMILSCLLKITISTDKSWEYICPFFHQFGIGSSAAVILTDLHFCQYFRQEWKQLLVQPTLL